MGSAVQAAARGTHRLTRGGSRFGRPAPETSEDADDGSGEGGAAGVELGSGGADGSIDGLASTDGVGSWDGLGEAVGAVGFGVAVGLGRGAAAQPLTPLPAGVLGDAVGEGSDDAPGDAPAAGLTRA